MKHKKIIQVPATTKELEDFVKELDSNSRREYKAKRAKILKCANCGTLVYYGAMNLISMSISRNKPSCSYTCNKALGQGV